MDGVFNILKPPGMTSHDVVSFLRRQFKVKKVGHAGTLDPEAVGVLPVCIGQGTRLIEYLMEHDKEYLCEMTLGITTTTQDAWGEVVEKKDYHGITRDMVEDNLVRFRGEIPQVVPAFSAVKVQGEPLYKKARKGELITPITRKIHIYKINLIRFDPPKVGLLIHCSKGTYVRTICHDIGETLGVGGHMSFLLRSRVGEFCLKDSLTLGEIALLHRKSLLPMEYCLGGLRKIVLAKSDIEKLRMGQKVALRKENETAKKINKGKQINDVAILDEGGRVQAIVSTDAQTEIIELKPKKVFNRE